MKRLTLKLLVLGALTLTGAAFADTDNVANSIMGVQLNPIMQGAFEQANTSISIHNHPFIVVSPAVCAMNNCTVVLDYLHNDPKTFIVLHETMHDDKEAVKAKVITIFPQELYQLSYQLPLSKDTALNVTDMRRLYR